MTHSFGSLVASSFRLPAARWRSALAKVAVSKVAVSKVAVSRVAVSIFALSGVAWPAALAADEAAARKYLDQAKQQVADKAPTATVQTTLQLAEAELAGVDAAKKEPIVLEIAAIRDQMAAVDGEVFKQNTLRELDRNFETAQKLLGVRQSGIVRMLDDLDKTLNDTKVQTALGTQKLGEYRTKLGTFQSVNRTKLGESAVEEMKRQVEFAEGKLPETLKELNEGSPAAKDAAAASFERRHQEFLTLAKEAPKGDAAAAELTTRMEAMQAQVTKAYGTMQAGEVHDRLKRDWESYADGWKGWETETTPPKFADLASNQSQANSRLGAPKTVDLVNQSTRFLERLSANEQAKPFLEVSPVKELIAAVTKLRDDSQAKAYGFAEAILRDAEAAPFTENGRSRLNSFVFDDLRLALPGHPQLAALQQRGQIVLAKFDSTAKAGVDAKNQVLTQMQTEAASRWPTLLETLPETTDQFDPAKPEASEGKLLRFSNVDNRAGWDYGAEGGFDFAMAIDGKPVAGKFSPEVRLAVDEMVGKTGTPLPDANYDIIAMYEGEKGILQRRVQGDAQFSGDLQGSVRAEVKQPVDAPIIKIVGLYCGPVAVLGPVGASRAEVVATNDVLSGGGFFFRLIDLLVMLLAGLCVLLKAQFAPLSAMPQLGVARENLTDRNQKIIGFVFLGLAVYRIIVGYVLYGLIGNLALAGSGVFLALGYFQKQSWFKPDWGDQLRTFAVPIGITCAVIGVIRLFIGGMLVAL